MARPRVKGNSSYNGLGLSKANDKKLIAILAKKGVSCKHVIRTLLEPWIENQIIPESRNEEGHVKHKNN